MSPTKPSLRRSRRRRRSRSPRRCRVAGSPSPPTDGVRPSDGCEVRRVGRVVGADGERARRSERRQVLGRAGGRRPGTGPRSGRGRRCLGRGGRRRGACGGGRGGASAPPEQAAANAATRARAVTPLMVRMVVVSPPWVPGESVPAAAPTARDGVPGTAEATPGGGTASLRRVSGVDGRREDRRRRLVVRLWALHRGAVTRACARWSRLAMTRESYPAEYVGAPAPGPGWPVAAR